MEQRQLPNEPFELLRCRQAYMFHLVLGILADKSEEAVVKWWHLLNHSYWYLRWNWKCYNSVATANFDRNGKMQPTAECHGLQLKHSGAHKVLLPLLFDLQHRFEAAEVIGIAKLFFPKPQQHCNQSTSLVHSPPPNSIESCTWYSWTCNAWKKQAGSRRFCWPNTEFCSILAVSCPWWSIIPICETASAEPSAESCSTETGKTFCKSLFFWEAEHWTKTSMTMLLTKTKCGKQIHIWAYVLCGQYIYRSPRCSQEGS